MKDETQEHSQTVSPFGARLIYARGAKAKIARTEKRGREDLST